MQIGANIPTILEKNLLTQPFILTTGRPSTPEQVFVVVERQTIPCTSLLQGVDICFKIIYILDMEFPWQTQHVWDFFQKFVYGLGEGKGRGSSVPAVTLFRNFLEKNIK
jgi:hypothetical protein